MSIFEIAAQSPDPILAIKSLFRFVSTAVFSEDLMGGGGGDGLDVSNGGGGDDPELEAIKARCREMEEEALKLKQVIFAL